jgi:chorismate lyase/3-hydroxybenzoate synthase
MTIPQSTMTVRRVSETTARPDVSYVEYAQLPFALTKTGTHPMAVVTFRPGLSDAFPCPVIALDLPQIDGPPMAEVWTCDRPVQIHTDPGCSIAMNGDFLIGSISLHEDADRSLDAAAYEAYKTMLHRLHGLGYPYLWRIWNYFPRINDDQDGLERYRRFCLGRHHALTEMLADFPSSLPAATAVGTKSGPLQVMFMAGTQAAIHLGNPRQLNAYEYPRNYGPRSPSFARATLTRSEEEYRLYLAGTASVVGHATRHAGLPREQTEETIRNIQAVLDQAKHAAGFDLIGAQRQALYKVYVRDSGSLPDIQDAIMNSPLSREQVLFLHSDLCRKELLIEIEGLVIAG